MRYGTAQNEFILLHHHDPLVPALAILNQRSHNFYGEQIARSISVHNGGTGTYREAADEVQKAVQTLDPVIGDNLFLFDGSGLSYDNRATARSVTELLAAMYHHPLSQTYYQTLKDKWSGKTLGKVKTGSLNVARCLAGYVTIRGERYAFAFLCDRGTAKSISWGSNYATPFFIRYVRICHERYFFRLPRTTRSDGALVCWAMGY